MQVAEVVPEPAGPLSPENREVLARAHERAAKIRKAAGVASFNGWATAIFAGLSAPFAFFSLSGFFVTAGLSLVAYQEFQGRKRLLKFDPSAARMLGWNQLGLLSVIIIYSLWSMYYGWYNTQLFSDEISKNPELSQVLNTEEIDELARYVILLTYSLVIVLSVVFQGANAWYYFSRRKHIEAYLQETPEWAVEVQQLNAAG